MKEIANKFNSLYEWVRDVRELMGVHGESQPRELASPGDHRAHARIRQWPLTLGEKHIRCVSCQGFEFSKARMAVPVSGGVLGTPCLRRLTCKSP